METASTAKPVGANSAAHERILRPVSHLDVIRITIFGDAKRVTAAETELIVP
jgi:hypothetical protein